MSEPVQPLRVLTASALVVCLISLLASADETDASKRAGASEKTAKRNLWYTLSINDQPSGYVRESELRAADGSVEYISFVKMSLRRGQDTASLEMRTSTLEDREGRVLSFSNESKQSKLPVLTTGRIVDQEHIELSVEAPGTTEPRISKLPYDASSIGPHATWRRMLTQLKMKGDRYEATTFVADQLRSLRQEFVHEGQEKVDLPGIGALETRRIKGSIHMGEGPPLEQVVWVDADGLPAQLHFPLGSMKMVLQRSTREAIEKTNFSSPPELFLSSAVEYEGKLPPAPKRAVYLLRHAGSGDAPPRPLQPSGAAGQELRELERPGDTEVRVTSVEGKASVALPPPRTAAQSKELAPYLAASATLQSDDAKIIAAAKRAVAGETHSLDAAKKLERWVHSNLHEKNLETAFATASEVFETRQGDCTEHAVLLAAMARAVDIPARVVTGLTAYRDTFVGHMWTEVWVGDWVPLDATLGKGIVHADHIALSTSSLSAESTADLFLSLLPLLGKLHIEVREAE